MKAGFFETDITPSIGMERPATYYKIYVQKINDPLKVRAAVVTDGKQTFAFAGVDICYLGDNIKERVRSALPEMKIMLSASHTHYGGPMGRSKLPADFPELPGRLMMEESVCGNPGYTDHLVGQIVTAIRMAEKNLEEVELSFGRGNAEGVTFNRGFKMKNGHRATHPGKGNPDIVAPFSPIDTEVGVVGFWRKDNGAFLGCMVSFNCHGTCDGTGATADWPGQMVRTVKAVMGPECGVVYLYGCAGDITQIDNLSLRPLETGPESSRVVGVTVGAEVLKVLMRAEKGEIDRLEYTAEHIMLGRRHPSAESLKNALEIVARPERDTAFHFAKERIIADALYRISPKIDFEIQLFQLGPLVIAAMPGELFCAIGMEIKKRSKFPFTWVSSLANDLSCGYIPTADVLDPVTGGGYESRLTSGTCTVPEAAAEIVEKASAMIAAFSPESVPEGPRVEPSRKVWSYGCNLPELE